MEPKAYSASPVGATFLVAGVSRSTGSVVFDPSLPLRDVNAGINGIFAGVGTTFSAFGKLALLSAAVPLATGKLTGAVGEDARSVTRRGLTDVRLRFSINLWGNEAMPVREFAKAPRRTIVGASMTVVAPTGAYDQTRLINLGTNRWAFKPEFGVAVPRGRWDIDAYVGLWVFTSNSSFYPGTIRRTQEPMVATQGHVSYTFRPRLWVAVDGTWYSGGRTRSGDGETVGGVNNTRLGATLSLPVGRQQSIKASYSAGVAVRTGTDFRSFAFAWQWLWFRS
jgi:hypothetical protein